MVLGHLQPPHRTWAKILPVNNETTQAPEENPGEPFMTRGKEDKGVLTETQNPDLMGERGKL